MQRMSSCLETVSEVESSNTGAIPEGNFYLFLHTSRRSNSRCASSPLKLLVPLSVNVAAILFHLREEIIKSGDSRPNKLADNPCPAERYN